MTECDYGAIVEARMGSTRLPGKSLKQVSGKALIERVLDRVTAAKRVDRVVLATTTNPLDDVLDDVANRLGVHCFRGSEDNVLQRVLEAALTYRIANIVELHGDNPFLDPVIIDSAIELFSTGNHDYVSNTLESTFPRGLRVQVFPTNKLREVFYSVNDSSVNEHVSLYFYEHPELFRLGNLRATNDVFRPDIRLTVDTAEDLQLVSRVYEDLASEGRVPGFATKDVLRIIDQNGYALINTHVQSKPVRSH